MYKTKWDEHDSDDEDNDEEIWRDSYARRFENLYEFAIALFRIEEGVDEWESTSEPPPLPRPPRRVTWSLWDDNYDCDD